MKRRFLGGAGAIALFAAAAIADSASFSLSPLRSEDWTRQAAAHLLRRAGFGGTPQEVDGLHAMGLDAAVDYLVEYTRIAYTNPPPPIDPELRKRFEPGEARAASEEERQAERERRRRLERQTFEEIRLWWIERMVESPRPLEERMTLFWHGLFTSGFREVQNPVFMLEQNELLRRYALGSFRDLLIGISRDRAMLRYLDGARNRKEEPNENYARELMELFTLGVGNYTERDVREAARAFTGWSFDEGGFVFRRALHDDGVKTVLGRTGRLDGADVIDAILEQRACSLHLARKLLVYFCRPDPEKRLVEALAAEIRRQRYQLKPVLRTLFRSQAFYHPQARGSLVKSPVDVLVGTARTLGVRIEQLLEAERALAAMGQELMQPPNVKGWDGGPAWINTATLFRRYNVVGRLIYGDDGTRPAGEGLAGAALGDAPPASRLRDRLARAARRSDVPGTQAPAAKMSADSVVAVEASEEPAVSRLSGGPQPPFDPMTWIDEAGARTPEQVVDLLAGHLLAVPLPAEKRAVLVQYVSQSTDSARRGQRRADVYRTLTHLLCSTPEYQMN